MGFDGQQPVTALSAVKSLQKETNSNGVPDALHRLNTAAMSARGRIGLLTGGSHFLRAHGLRWFNNTLIRESRITG